MTSEMFVCENCMLAIESREGQQKKIRHYFDINDDNTQVNQCEWCHECFSESEEIYEF